MALLPVLRQGGASSTCLTANLGHSRSAVTSTAGAVHLAILVGGHPRGFPEDPVEKELVVVTYPRCNFFDGQTRADQQDFSAVDPPPGEVLLGRCSERLAKRRRELVGLHFRKRRQFRCRDGLVETTVDVVEDLGKGVLSGEGVCVAVVWQPLQERREQTADNDVHPHERAYRIGFIHQDEEFFH